MPVVFSGRQFGVFLAAGYEESKIPNTVPEVKVKANFFQSNDWHKVTIEVDANGVRCDGDRGARLVLSGTVLLLVLVIEELLSQTN